MRDADVLRGHAVRANYLAAGAVDVAVESARRRAARALSRRSGTNTVARRTYVTGGQGSHHQDEAFGEDWELPSDRAYSETCAAIGVDHVQLAAAARPRRRRATRDLIERTLFNVVATSPCADGTRVLLREHAAPA